MNDVDGTIFQQIEADSTPEFRKQNEGGLVFNRRPIFGCWSSRDFVMCGDREYRAGLCRRCYQEITGRD